jgi:hypothetical protein
MDTEEHKNGRILYTVNAKLVDNGLKSRPGQRGNWGIKVPLPMLKEKYCMSGLMHP